MLILAVLLLLASLGCSGGPETPAASQPPPAAANTDGGRAEVRGTLPSALNAADAIVVLEPAIPRDLPVKTQPAVMDQSGYQFIPALLLAQSGQTVQFRNSEDVLHNVRVTEVANDTPVFNVATTPFGAYAHTFERTGLYTVTCDIHSTMRADILVSSSPYTARTAADGAFAITDIPPGKYTLTLYAGPAPVARSVDLKSGLNDLGAIQ
jgi:plastocyanin